LKWIKRMCFAFEVDFAQDRRMHFTLT